MEKLNVTIQDGVQTLEVRTGKALELTPPINVKISGILDSPLKWLEKRIGTFDQKSAHILVDREQMHVRLVLNETSRELEAIICGSLELHPIFKKFGINRGKYITPFEMAELFKMNRIYFENQQKAMELVSLLKNFKAKVNKEVEKSLDEVKGDKRLLLDQKVESNLPPAIQLEIPIFKGYNKERIECEVYFNAEDLTCTLVSAQANDLIESLKDGAIDEVLESIRNVAPEIAIIEI